MSQQFCEDRKHPFEQCSNPYCGKNACKVIDCHLPKEDPIHNVEQRWARGEEGMYEHPLGEFVLYADFVKLMQSHRDQAETLLLQICNGQLMRMAPIESLLRSRGLL